MGAQGPVPLRVRLVRVRATTPMRQARECLGPVGPVVRIRVPAPAAVKVSRAASVRNAQMGPEVLVRVVPVTEVLVRTLG